MLEYFFMSAATLNQHPELLQHEVALTLMAHCALEYFEEIDLLMNTWMLIDSHFPNAVRVNLSAPLRVLFQSHHWTAHRQISEKIKKSIG